MQAERSRTADLLAWLGVAGMLAVALVRSTSMQSAWRWFDVDPIRSPGALEAVGASGGILLDAALLLSASLVLVAMALFAGATLRPFAVTLIVGFITGTYSSIYIAAPIVLLWTDRSKVTA